MRHRFFVPAILFITTLGLFLPAVGFEFVSWDDDMFIYDNPLITSPSIDNTLLFWKESYKGLYMPITATIWSFLAWLSGYMPAKPYGVNPSLFHSTNLIVHLLSVFTIFSILKMLLTHGFKDKDDDVEDPDLFKIYLSAGAGTLIFAIHPMQVEPVVWASELKDLLCGLFSFLAIREYLAFAFASKHEEESGNKQLHYALACMAFLLALLSKPAAVVVPLVLLIIDHWAVKRSLKNIAVSLAGWFITAFLFAVLAKTVQQSGVMLASPPLWARPFIAGDALAFYLYKLALPLQLAIDYSRNPDYVMRQWWIYATWLLPAAVAVAILLIKKREVWLVSFGIFTAALLPVLGFVSFMFESRSTVADHYLYMPMLGVALAVSWLVFKHHTKAVGMVCVVITILFGLRSASHLPVWKNETTLYLNVLEINPASALANYNLGNILKKQGKFKEAIYRYKAALETDPLSMDVHNNLGVALTQSGNLIEALYNYRRVVKYRPEDANAHNNLGVALDRLDKPDEAITHYMQALKLRPDLADAHNNIGLALEVQGKLDDAITHYKKAIQLQPGDANAHNNLGIALSKQGKYEQAITSHTRALMIRPDFPLARKQLETAKAKLKNR